MGIRDEKEQVEELNTNCFTYEVKMIIQILAEDETSAKEKLDSQGGYITLREVKLMDMVQLYNGKEKDK